jgi:general secretion pathway protein I
MRARSSNHGWLHHGRTALRAAMKRARKAGNDAAGFTVIEVIAALAILSLSLALLFSTMSEAIHRQQRAKTLAEASVLAQSLLARIGTEFPLRQGDAKGDFPNGFRWETEIAAYGDASDAQEWPVAAYRVGVTIFARNQVKQPAASLTTIRLAPRDPGR